MKKIIFFSAAFTLLSFAACKKENAKAVEQKSSTNVKLTPESNVSYFNLDQPKSMNSLTPSLARDPRILTCVQLKVNVPRAGDILGVEGPTIPTTYFPTPINR